MTVLGKAIAHESARGHVTGSALYTNDLLPRRGGAASAWPVTVPHARARIRAVDTAAALAAPGVLLVLGAGDVPGENELGPSRRDEPLFPSEVQFFGQAVAWVIAETEEAAKLAAGRVVVDVEPLPAVLSIEQGIAEESYLTEPLFMRRGDAEAALAAAPRRVSGELFVGGQEHVYLETNAALAEIDDSGHMLVHSSTQHPSETQEIVARVLGVSRNRVVVQALRMGGAFGGKEVQANAWAAVAAIAAQKLGRPVGVRLDRHHDMTLTGKRHPFLARFEVGFDDDGRILGAKVELFADGGWCLDLTEPIVYRAMFHIDNCYRIPAITVMGRGVRTNKTSQTAFRGFGGPQGMVVIEDILDRIARTLELPPRLVRERNFYREGDETHYGQPVRDAARIERIWSALLRSSSYDTRRAEIERFNATSPHAKRGIAITPVKFGISFTATFYNQAGALVIVYADGSVQVNHGGTEMGQGLHTKMMQVAAHTLGVRLEQVRAMPTRTDKVPNTSATAASSGSDLNGAAVKRACESIRSNLAEVAAAELAVPACTVLFEDGQVFPRDEPSRALDFSALARKAYLARVPLFSSGYYRTPEIHFDKATGTGKPFHYFAYGAAVTEVEVDRFTGAYSFRRVDILHDVGDSLSPLVDLGQVEGGFVQGLGWLTLEECVWDARGRFATSGLSTYKLPGLGECPLELNVALLEKATEPGVVYGSKAVGEPPLMLAISAREALRDAVAQFGTGGIIELGCPSTPETVYFAIRERTESAGGARRAAE